MRGKHRKLNLPRDGCFRPEMPEQIGPGPSKTPKVPARYKGYWYGSLDADREAERAYREEMRRKDEEKLEQEIAALEKKLGYSLHGDTTTDTPPQKP